MNSLNIEANFCSKEGTTYFPEKTASELLTESISCENPITLEF